MKENRIRVALVGQPNVGKSSLINAISNAKLHVGNFAGVTVEKTEVQTRYCDPQGCEEYEIDIVDLPGAYSLNDYTQEERVTKEFLLEGDYELIVNVVDATHLQRNLLLTAELLELGRKMVVALNMNDEAEKEGIHIDAEQLSVILGVPVVKTSARTKEGIDELLHQIVEVAKQPSTRSKIVYSDFIEEEIDRLVHFFEEKHYRSEIPYRYLAIRLLKEDTRIYKQMHDEPIWIELLPILREALDHIYLHAGKKDIAEIFADEHFAFAKGAKMEVISTKEMRAKSLTQRIDNLLINKYLGIPIFLFLMWGLFQLTFTLGAVPMDWIQAGFDWLAEGARNLLGNGELSSVVADGVIGGVGAVVSFLPNIVILFIGIALLETTGYMARVSFLLDGFFHKFGLHGKSFIPLVTGFGCTVPAYMAARTLKSRSDRLITLFILGFFSCSARIPVYVLFAGAFFGAEHAGNILFLIYITGAILGLIAAKILRVFFFKGEDDPFVMEMPKYRLPSLKLIYHVVYGQAKDYLSKAGTFILAAAVLVWFASNYPKNPQLEAQYQQKIERAASPELKSALQAQLQTRLLEESYLGQIGKLSEPFFAPLGFDWKMSVALEAGLAAKEVIVSTLGVLYSIGDEVSEESRGLQQRIRKEISLPAAVAFIVFVMIYLPCMAAMAVFVRESGSWIYLGYLFAMTTATAWLLSFLAYNATRLITGGV
ncbi:ferrous iron transport protein B [Nitratifractor sp.]